MLLDPECREPRADRVAELGKGCHDRPQIVGARAICGFAVHAGCGAVRGVGTHRDVLASIENFRAGGAVARYDYDVDAIGRRTNRTDTGILSGDNSFDYDAFSQVSGATMDGDRYCYVYDPIGNRLTAAVNAVTNAYDSNPLNQYTNILCASAPPRETPIFHDLDGNLTNEKDWGQRNRNFVGSILWAG